MWKVLDLGYKFGLLHYILLDLDRKSFGQQIIIILIRYFTGTGFGNTSTTNLDYNYALYFTRLGL